MQYRHLLTAGLVAVGLTGFSTAYAAEHQASDLGGPKYTCMGGTKAGNEAGVAEFTGKWFKDWPGLKKGEKTWVPGPYADEEPKFKITASNYKKYADHLTKGQEKLFKMYPDEFYMLIYQSHRDFKMPTWRCEAARYNFKHAKLTDGGLNLKGHGGAVPFPFPDTGLQAIWNVVNGIRAYSEEVTYDIADVYGNGSITWGRVHFKALNVTQYPDPSKRKNYSNKIRAYFFQQYILPEANAGQVAVGFQPNNFAAHTTQAWQYMPGIRRVRKAPEVGFDYPIPPSGFRTTDSDYIFNGSPERYNWKIKGTKTIYVPYNNFKINSPKISYDELLLSHTINPKYVRYEPHRVHVVVGTLKPDMRHIFQKRVVYIDEDTWVALLGSNYDQQGKLARVNMIVPFYSYKSGTYHRGVSVYRNLTSGNYEATYLVNERPPEQYWKINIPMKPREFSPQAAMRAGR